MVTTILAACVNDRTKVSGNKNILGVELHFTSVYSVFLRNVFLGLVARADRDKGSESN